MARIYDDDKRSLGCIRITLLVIYSLLQLAAIAIGCAAIAIPDWLKVSNSLVYVQDGDDVRFINKAGLWQICQDEPLSGLFSSPEDSSGDSKTNVEDTFTQIGSDDCMTGKLVENFYKKNKAVVLLFEKQLFEEDAYTEFIATRAMVLLFVIFGFLKLVSLLMAKCQNGWCTFIFAMLAAFVELGSSIGGLLAYALIQQEAKDNIGDGNIRDYWGVGYVMFLAAAAVAFVSNLGFCF
eukprot:TRINITY_DN3808_c0_g1_i1.p1 TRINITY_DN3808_c0_g1~~TRINITY_DN3808_c0_g1_i1.p1  ORF type:complete len:278 (-),score=32.98 TRINITY_DN3808_c0_g1_i1:258-968(-)